LWEIPVVFEQEPIGEAGRTLRTLGQCDRSVGFACSVFVRPIYQVVLEETARVLANVFGIYDHSLFISSIYIIDFLKKTF